MASSFLLARLTRLNLALQRRKGAQRFAEKNNIRLTLFLSANLCALCASAVIFSLRSC